ncbi:conserved hypothetical protein [Echinococcus multilocularis]|uniref:Uncharacterized protein n=1 Tax=Echinococcus multilocularis TaxID=6211 RepID=A0A068Y804_ECHMU|nr:conserved hypothetical protein [Echinococcus multilocularis]
MDDDNDKHSICRSGNCRVRRKLKSAHQRPGILNEANTHHSRDGFTSKRFHNTSHDRDDLELTLRQLDDEKIRSMPPKFWKDMVIRVQYLLDANRLLRADVAHLSGEHHCPLHTCKYSSGCCAQTFYSAIPAPANHDECDRRCQDLEDEVEALKRERSRLRQQSSSIQDLIRSIGQRQITLQRDLMNSRKLEAENAMQRRLLSKLSSERDALVSVLKERDIGYAHLLQSIRQNNKSWLHDEQLTYREKELEALIQRLLGMSHSLPDTTAVIETASKGEILRQVICFLKKCISTFEF